MTQPSHMQELDKPGIILSGQRKLKWRLLIDTSPSDDLTLNVGLENAIMERVGKGESPPTLRIWQNHQSFSVGRYTEKIPGFQMGLKTLKARGTRVFRRVSGGDIAPQGEGIINISWFAPASKLPLSIDNAYLFFGQGLKEYLAQFGQRVTFGKLDHTFCDGIYNLLIEGKKIAGSAQVRQQGAILVHAFLLTSCSLGEIVETINAFYQFLSKKPAHRSKITSLESQVDEVSTPYVIKELIESYNTFLRPLHLGHYTESELKAAQILGKSLEY